VINIMYVSVTRPEKTNEVFGDFHVWYRHRMTGVRSLPYYIAIIEKGVDSRIAAFVKNKAAGHPWSFVYDEND
jgi:hypothetical protein